MQTAGFQLRSAIKKIGLTQAEAAEKLNISRETIIMWMKRDAFSENQIENIKEVLGIVIQNPTYPDINTSALEKGFAAKLLDLIQRGELYPKQMVAQIKEELAEAQKQIGKLEEKIRQLEKR